MPENMAANGGTGSTIFYDRIISKNWCCCGCFEGCAKLYMHTDMLLGMWVFFIMSAVLLPGGVYIVVIYPNEANSWLDLIMTIGFTVGAGLMAYSSYPENFGSSIFFDTMTCSKRKSSAAVE